LSAEDPGETEGNPALASLSRLEAAADAAMNYFYGQLFAMDTEIAAMFPAAMDVQRQRFFRALARIATEQAQGEASGHASGQDDLTTYLEHLGRAHRKDGVRDRHFETFRRALLATLHRFAADVWNDAAQATWEAAFDHAATIMLEAAKRDEERSPAWWICTVTSTEPRAPGVAVLTLAPDQPLDYLPGQHVSVQTLHWPRLWRTYSIANAPRPDGTLSLHVRATNGGLVSNALVHHVAVGDPLVVGAPAGAMVADTRSARDVLCLAGGTGLAPIKAIIEAITATAPAGPASACSPDASSPGAASPGAASPGRRREIALYLGVRYHRDLYDLADLRSMELAYPWLQVIPAVSDEPARTTLGEQSMHGTVPELAGQASWPGRDVYISGPDEMIIKTVRLLRELGAPAERMHYDITPETAEAL
jgi:NAD(P)H-flavin reductase/hemoglobin-like flavoprotein